MPTGKKLIFRPSRRLAFKHWKTAKDVARLEVSQDPKDVLHDTEKSLIRVGKLRFKEGRTREVAVKFFKWNPYFPNENVETPVTNEQAVVLQGRIAKIAKMFPELPKMGMHKLPSGEWVLVSEFFARKATPQDIEKRKAKYSGRISEENLEKILARRWQPKLKRIQEGGIFGGYDLGIAPFNVKSLKRFAGMCAELVNANMWGFADMFEVLSTKTGGRIIPFDVIEFLKKMEKNPGRETLNYVKNFFTAIRSELHGLYGWKREEIFVREVERRLKNPRLLMRLRGDFYWFTALHGVNPIGRGEHNKKLVYGSKEFHSYECHWIIEVMGGPDWWFRSEFHRLGFTPEQLSQYLHLKYYERIIGSPGYEPKEDKQFQAINPLKLRRVLPQKLKEIPLTKKLWKEFEKDQERNLDWSSTTVENYEYHHYYELPKTQPNSGK